MERAAHAAALPLQGLGGQQAAQPLPHQARVHARLRHQPLEYQFYVGALELGCRLTRAANGRQVVLAGSRGPHSVPTNAATIMWPSCSGLSRFSSTALGGDAVLQDPAQVIGVGAVEGAPQARLVEVVLEILGGALQGKQPFMARPVGDPTIVSTACSVYGGLASRFLATR